MSKFWERLVKVTIESAGQQITLNDLKVSFDITLIKGEALNEGTVKIWNLSPSSLSALQKAKTTLILSAGYAGTGGMATIFKGDIGEVESTPQGADIVTKVYLFDGLSLLKGKRVSNSWSGSTSVFEIIRALGRVLGTTVSFEGALKDKRFESGFVGYGNTLQVVKVLCSKINADWTIQQGKLSVYEKDTSVISGVFLTASTGLIGIPEKLYKKNKPIGVKCVSFLLPLALPNDIIKIESRNIKGAVKLTKINHVGNNYEKDWYSKLEGVSFA